MNLKLTFIQTTFLIVFVLFNLSAFSQDTNDMVAGIPVNYDETQTGTYTLPDPLVLENGKKVTNAKTWINKRRPEILELYKSEQFGRRPGREHTSFKVFEQGSAFNNTAIRKQVTLYFTEDTLKYKADMALYLPANTNKPVPVFLMISFMPNSLKINDSALREEFMWVNGKRVPTSEGKGWGWFDVDKFISQGIGVATIYYGDIEPDFGEGIKYGIRGHFLKPGETYPADDEWGAISAWTWGLSCAMDYLQTDKDVDAEKVALHGVSRLGKTVLWAGAQDERFGMIIASCSGEGGAALSMRDYGETIKHMIAPSRFFYQFCANRAKYADNPQESPIDAHMLISLIAPRPLLLQTGDTDDWSDAKGEFLAAVAAEPVYELLGKTGLKTQTFPKAGVPILNDMGYYMHAGGHGTQPDDFDIYVKFIKKHFFQ